MLNNAYILISEDLKNSKKEELQDKIKIFNEFTLAVDRMIAGEYVDTEYEGKPISKDYLEYIHKNKTGAFLKLSVRMGAILANAPKDKEHGKCTYVSKYGLEGAKEILNKITKEAIEIINCYGEKGEFLKELALYIANRNK